MVRPEIVLGWTESVNLSFLVVSSLHNNWQAFLTGDMGKILLKNIPTFSKPVSKSLNCFWVIQKLTMDSADSWQEKIPELQFPYSWFLETFLEAPEEFFHVSTALIHSVSVISSELIHSISTVSSG